MEIGILLSRLQKVKKLNDGSYLALCPSHADKNPSLHIAVKDNKILLSCQAGCKTVDVVKAMGLEMTDLFLKDREPKQPVKAEIVATYDYKDEQGNLLFQVCRMKPKSFRQRHKNDKGEWEWKMDGVRRILYHLPDLMLNLTDKVYIVEGEKDCDNLWGYGLVSTTSPGGANNWRKEYSELLKGRKVVIIPDNDKAGMEYAREVAYSLTGKATISCILLPEKVKDISDWLDSGADIKELEMMEQDISALMDAGKPEYKFDNEAVVWYKQAGDRQMCFRVESLRMERTGVHGKVTILCDYVPLGWSLFNIERSEDRTKLANLAYKQVNKDIKEHYTDVDIRRDLDIFCAGAWDFNLSSYNPELLYGDEAPMPINFFLKPYIVEGGGTIIFAAPGKGKSFTALLWAASVNHGVNKYWQVNQAKVLFINLERSRESVRRRLSQVNKVLGLPATKPMLILNARGKSLSDVALPCKKMVEKFGIEVIVLDSISRAGYGDLTENRPVNAIIDSLSSLCKTWVALAHTPRADESHVFGGIMFEAGADIVVRVSSDIASNGTLGTGYEITKSNDVPMTSGQVIWAMEFDETGLTGFRRARVGEFLEIEGKRKIGMLEAIEEYIDNQDEGDATASMIADEVGLNRSNVSSIINSRSDKFVKTRRVKTSQYYGLKTVNQQDNF